MPDEKGVAAAKRIAALAAEADEKTQAVMPAGSLLLYSGSVFHAGGENRSNGDRVGLNITYSLGWLRQEENQFLSCPPEIARDLEPGLQDLLEDMRSGALAASLPPEVRKAFENRDWESIPPKWREKIRKYMKELSDTGSDD